MPSAIKDIIGAADIGFITVRPFEEWKDDQFNNMTWTIRLLNAGESIQAMDRARVYIDKPYDVALQIETFIRSTIYINGVPPLSVEEVEEYNKQHALYEQSKLSVYDIMRIHTYNYEQPVLNRFDQLYAELLLKQGRKIAGKFLCERCDSEYTKSSRAMKGARHLTVQLAIGVVTYSMAEVICNKCLTDEEKEQDNPVVDVTESKKDIPLEESVPDEQVVEDAGVLEELECDICGAYSTPYPEQLEQHKIVCKTVEKEPT